VEFVIGRGSPARTHGVIPDSVLTFLLTMGTRKTSDLSGGNLAGQKEVLGVAQKGRSQVLAAGADGVTKSRGRRTSSSRVWMDWRDFRRRAGRCHPSYAYSSPLDLRSRRANHRDTPHARLSNADIASEAWVMYHWYVEAIPRSSGIWACQPRVWRRDTSSNLRGVPSGREGSKAIRPV
jgi:hypothetical protein